MTCGMVIALLRWLSQSYLESIVVESSIDEVLHLSNGVDEVLHLSNGVAHWDV